VRIFDQTFRTLERALDLRLARQGVLAGNLANLNTPGFTPRELDFAAAMGATGADSPGGASSPAGSAGATGSAELPLDLVGRPGPVPGPIPGLPGGRPSAAPNGAAPSAAGLDGNGVDADRTLVALSENALQYGMAAKAIAKKLAILRYVASDGNA
jgi:flagellar basal-body rod protein FlgB